MLQPEMSLHVVFGSAVRSREFAEDSDLSRRTRWRSLGTGCLSSDLGTDAQVLLEVVFWQRWTHKMPTFSRLGGGQWPRFSATWGWCDECTAQGGIGEVTPQCHHRDVVGTSLGYSLEGTQMGNLNQSRDLSKIWYPFLWQWNSQKGYIAFKDLKTSDDRNVHRSHLGKGSWRWSSLYCEFEESWFVKSWEMHRNTTFFPKSRNSRLCPPFFQSIFFGRH